MKVEELLVNYYLESKDRIVNANSFIKLKFNMYDIFDRTTGAVYLADEDSIIQKKNFPKHPIFQIFDINCIEAFRRYTCNLNDKVILRGPCNYYYGICFLGDLNIRLNEIIKTLKMVKEFFINISEIELTNMKYDNILDVKYIFAILDIIRNSVITNLFFCLMKKDQINDIYIFNEDNNSLVNSFYDLLYKIEYKLVDIILEQSNDLNEEIDLIIDNFINLQDKLIDEVKNNKTFYNNDLYIRYRKLREADNIMENIICINYAIDQIIKEKKDILSNNNIYLLGLNYGSLELSIIANIIFKLKNIYCSAGNIMKKFRKVYVESTNLQSYKINKNLKKKSYYIILDENIMTGNTLECVIKYLKEKDLNLLNIIIINYPSIARAKNIKFSQTSQIEKLHKNIKGMLFPCNYSKIFEYRNDFVFPYMDKLGTFDLYKYEILKNMYKNGLYNKNSAVGRISHYYKKVFF